MVVRLVNFSQVMLDFGANTFQPFIQDFLVVGHLVPDVPAHLPVGDIRDVRAGGNGGIGFFFQLVIDFFQVSSSSNFLFLRME